MGKKLSQDQILSRCRLFEEAAQAIEVYEGDDGYMENEKLEEAYVVKQLYSLSAKWHEKLDNKGRQNG